ncbi:MAG: hypothetical protein ACK5QT_05345 [Oligoflexia bacterium]
MITLFFSLALLASPLVAHSAPRSWQKHLPTMDERAQQASPWLRTLIHMHSIHSHDACDKKPQKNGNPNERCLEDFRRGLCREHVDLVFITEHRKSLAEISFQDMIPIRDNDRLLLEGGKVIGTEHTCPDGHKVTMYQGSENSMMALGLTRHPEPVPGSTLEQTYNALTPEAAASFRQAGGIVGMSHAEEKEKDIGLLRQIRPEVIEAYNLHANLLQTVKPKVRVGRTLETLVEVLSFISNPLVEPDLIFHAFFSENQPSLRKWSQLAMDGEVTGIAGTDAHQNAFPIKMWDVERVDSYRRSIRWFSNWIKAPKQPTRLQALDALKAGRSLVVFETLGDPLGFDFWATSAQGTHLMGDKISWNSVGGAGLTLNVRIPPQAQSQVKVQILKATDEGWVPVAQSNHQDLSYQPTEPGAYRAELRMIPRHLRRHLRTKGYLIREMPWVYSNAIYVR